MACQPKLVRAKAGGANESRTRDLLHAMQARYQLRYSPICSSAFERYRQFFDGSRRSCMLNTFPSRALEEITAITQNP
jgi:hypothetical protein